MAKIFNFGERLGLFLIVEAAGLSALASSALLLYILFRSSKQYRVRRVNSKDRSDSSDSIYFVNLMLAELIQAIGGLLNIQWIIDATITEDSLCKAQGIIKQIGDVTVALTSLVIAFHTFSVLVLRWRAPPIVARVALGCIWLFVILIIGISNAVHKNDVYYGDTDYWCWIKNDYTKERIGLEYIWLWLAAGLMVIMYGIIALVIRGNIVIEGNVRFNFGERRRSRKLTEADTVDDRVSKEIANLMMFYPAIYIVCVLPVTLVRWLQFADPDRHVPASATMFAGLLFSLSGLLNAILYKITRPDLVSGTAHATVAEKPRPGRPSDTGYLPDIETESLPHNDDGGMGHLPGSDSGSRRSWRA